MADDSNGEVREDGVVRPDPVVIEPEAMLEFRRRMVLSALLPPEEAIVSARLAWERLNEGVRDGTITSQQFQCAKEILDRVIGKPETRRIVKLESSEVVRACIRAVVQVYGKERREEFLKVLASELGIPLDEYR